MFGLRANANCHFTLKQIGLYLEGVYLDGVQQSEG